jgi:TRAP-type C4-dicarboxylate transport system substrate-binding protein
MRSKFWLIVAALCLSVSLLIPTISQAASNKPTELRFNYSMPGKTPPANGWNWFAEEMGKRSGGRVTVTTYPFGALFKIRQAVENIVAGTADLTNLSVRTFAKRYPLLSVTLIPTITWPNDTPGTVASGRAIMKLIREFPEMDKELEDFVVVWVTQLTSYNIISTKPIYKPSDLKGMKIGAGGVQGQFVKMHGGSGVAIVPPKSYLSLKTGVVDGMVQSYNSMGAYKLWEVAGHVTVVPMGRVPLPVVMNKQSYNSLSPDLQKMIMDVGDESLTVSTDGMYAGGKKGKVKLTNGGVKIFTPTAAELAVWTKAFQPMEAKWLADRKKEGFKVAPKVLARYKQLAAEASR